MHWTWASPLIAAQSRGIAVPGATPAVVVVADDEFVSPFIAAPEVPCALTAAQAAIEIAATSDFICHCIMLPPHFVLMQRASARREERSCMARATRHAASRCEGIIASRVGNRR
jgi:hypothetical protein